ncbi:hypothetical protein SNOG_07185 [Parastagonospora nodorum SN15]|uniref:Uncharacterized protein n=1 Tax=Phaeosphaeria nodorum (strain SN15 / ATCC MYA-4574 / FGSC 10173) TaxID=321614 RepID=Q0UM29_PHANO|nr:hypothetical protein SNOG_07185 [Parastagonospora nodorum SN15]EAT85836.2 hypothetical protein SNOG_07185 [Parastagonospora nodorum SN15]
MVKNIDDAMLSLNDALNELGKLRIRTDACKVDLNLSVEEAKACVEVFIDLLDQMIVPDIFTSSIDLELLRVLPDIINSPYINIEPGMYVMYYNALYFGLNQIRGLGDAQAQGMYLKILEAVPAWLESNIVTEMDGHTAALTAWTATSNHDYQLSWKFHCKSCHYVKTRKIDQVDLVPAKTFEEEDKKEGARYLYWHVLSTDMLFRLFYGKPTVVTEILNEIDDCKNLEEDEEIRRKVDTYCDQMRGLNDEWNLETTMKEDESQDQRFLFADHVMTIYAVIIGVRRLLLLKQPEKLCESLSTSLSILHPQEKLNHFISFYPFCAVFALYENILACADPSDCEQDVQLLEAIGETMNEASAKRTDFSPFAATINALNQVTRSFQNERRRAKDGNFAVGETADILRTGRSR